MSKYNTYKNKHLLIEFELALNTHEWVHVYVRVHAVNKLHINPVC